MEKSPPWWAQASITLSVALGLALVYVSHVGLNKVAAALERQAIAGERQAQAAEQQVKLIQEQNEAWTELKGLLAHIPTPGFSEGASSPKK